MTAPPRTTAPGPAVLPRTTAPGPAELPPPVRLLSGAGAAREASRPTLQYTGTHTSPTEMA